MASQSQPVEEVSEIDVIESATAVYRDHLEDGEKAEVTMTEQDGDIMVKVILTCRTRTCTAEDLIRHEHFILCVEQPKNSDEVTIYRTYSPRRLG